MKEFYYKLALFHANEKRQLQEENAFLWARLVNLIDVVLENSYGDGSGESCIREEAEATRKDLIEHVDK